MLQESGLFRYAATLTAIALKGGDQAIPLERWANHIQQASMTCHALPSTQNSSFVPGLWEVLCDVQASFAYVCAYEV